MILGESQLLSLQHPFPVLTDSSLTRHRNTDALQSPHGGMLAQYLLTLTDFLTEISRDPYRILPESLQHYTEHLQHPYRLPTDG